MKLLDRTTSTDLTDVETTLRQAESLFLRHEDNASAKLLARLERQRLTPEQRWSVLLLKGWLCHGCADHVQAMKYADRVLSESQDAYYRGRAHHLRGLSHCGFAYAAPDASEPEVLAATREYELALEMLTDFPERIRVYSSMAILLADTGQADQAIAMLETVLQQSHLPSPDLDWLHASLGELYAQDKGDSWYAPFVAASPDTARPCQGNHPVVAEAWIAQARTFSVPRSIGGINRVISPSCDGGLTHRNQSLLDCVFHKLHPVVKVELVHDILSVPVDGLDADDQGIGDLAVGVAVGDAGEHLALALC